MSELLNFVIFERSNNQCITSLCRPNEWWTRSRGGAIVRALATVDNSSMANNEDNHVDDAVAAMAD